MTYLGWDLAAADDPECLGICHGLIGKVEHPSVFEARLVIIKECSPIGKLYGNHEVYKIKSIAFLQLGPEDIDIGLQKCHKHKSYEGMKRAANTGIFDLQKNVALSKTWGTLKSAGNTIKNTTQQAATMATNQVKATVRKRDNTKDKEKFEKRIIEEFYKIFTDTNSFYFCRTSDITNSLQRLYKLQSDNKIDPKAIWKSVDDRFFWNKHMLKELISKNVSIAQYYLILLL